MSKIKPWKNNSVDIDTLLRKKSQSNESKDDPKFQNKMEAWINRLQTWIKKINRLQTWIKKTWMQ